MKKPTPTFLRGAALERQAIRQVINRLARLTPAIDSESLIERLQKFLAGRRLRYEARPGGLGRKKARATGGAR